MSTTGKKGNKEASPQVNPTDVEAVRRLAEEAHAAQYDRVKMALLRLVAPPPKRKMKKVGRPRSKVTAAMAVRSSFLTSYDVNLQMCLEVLAKENIAIEHIAGISAKASPVFPIFERTNVPGFDKSGLTQWDKSMFELGSLFTMMVIRGAVIELVANDLPRITNASKQIKSTIKWMDADLAAAKAMGLSETLSNQFRAEISGNMPADLRRKQAKPNRTRQQINRFILAVKGCSGIRTVSMVAEKLRVPEEEVRSLYLEAKRQRRSISLQNDQKGDYFVIK